MNKFFRIVILIVGLGGCAHADWAQLSDSATTAVALSHGFVEANPLFGSASWPVIAGVKIGVTQVVKLTPESICTPGLIGLTISGYGAALWNVGVMAGCGIAALPIAVVVGFLFWDQWVEDAIKTCQDPWGHHIFAKETAHEVSDDEEELLIFRN